jgi:hypothetical protein
MRRGARRAKRAQRRDKKRKGRLAAAGFDRMLTRAR